MELVSYFLGGASLIRTFFINPFVLRVPWVAEGPEEPCSIHCAVRTMLLSSTEYPFFRRPARPLPLSHISLYTCVVSVSLRSRIPGPGNWLQIRKQLTRKLPSMRDGDHIKLSVQRFMPDSWTLNTNTAPLIIISQHSESFRRRTIRGIIPCRAAWTKRRACMVFSTRPMYG